MNDTYKFEEIGQPILRLKLGLTDSFGMETNADIDIPVFEELDITEIEELFRAFNNFLNLAGYPRPRGHVLDKDITYEEYDYLCDALEKYRNTDPNQISLFK